MRLPIYSKSYTVFVLLFGIMLSISSCNTSSSLTDSGMVQKRRYQKGYHLNLKSRPTDKAEEEVLAQKEVEAPLVAALDGQIAVDEQLAPKDLKALPFQKRKSESKVREKHKNLKPTKFRAEESSLKQKESEYRVRSQQPDYYGSSVKKLNTVALISFLCAMVSLIVAGIPLGLAALILGIIGLSQINNYPEMYKGKGFAIVGIIIGLISIVVVLALLSAM